MPYLMRMCFLLLISLISQIPIFLSPIIYLILSGFLPTLTILVHLLQLLLLILNLMMIYFLYLFFILLFLSHVFLILLYLLLLLDMFLILLFLHLFLHPFLLHLFLLALLFLTLLIQHLPLMILYSLLILIQCLQDQNLVSTSLNFLRLLLTTNTKNLSFMLWLQNTLSGLLLWIHNFSLF